VNPWLHPEVIGGPLEFFHEFNAHCFPTVWNGFSN
jgi:hypothetical protein